jgi:hypothetical protein
VAGRFRRFRGRWKRYRTLQDVRVEPGIDRWLQQIPLARIRLTSRCRSRTPSHGYDLMVTTPRRDPGSCMGLGRLLRHLTLASHCSASYCIVLAKLSTSSTQRGSPSLFGLSILQIEASRGLDLAR